MVLKHTLDGLIGAAIERRVFPGVVVLVAAGGTVLHHAAYGTTMYAAPGSRPVMVDTIYDVASLTKVFTATAALALADRGLIELDAPVAVYLPELHRPDVTVRHLLTHTSGLDIRLSVLRQFGRDGLMARVYAAAPKHPPGMVVAYTNVNSLLLGEIVARVTGTPLDAAIEALVLAPLGLRETCFCPPAMWRPRIAPTEIDAEWRGGLVHGVVHDESAYALGGVAGHAGLFSTASEIGRFCYAWLEMMVDGGWWMVDCTAPFDRGYPGMPILRAETARMAVMNQTEGLNLACGLGWMLDRGFMGAAPPGSFGHTGFTGPVMVVAPQHRLVVVVLSNRVYPQRQPPSHHPVTAAIVDVALHAVE
jgi:CubicO group peptidase (beta-lactamase class C family)